MHLIHVPPLRWWHYLADGLLWPVMHVATGTFFILGKPQRTHHWHMHTPKPEEVKALDVRLMVAEPGDQNASARRLFGFIPLNHLPILGGWKQFVVIAPTVGTDPWHIGFLADDLRKVNRVPLRGPVKMLIGPGPVRFFGVCSRTGRQVPLLCVGRGRLWGRRYRQVSLL